MSIPLLSSGQESTLGNWRDLVATVWGEGNPAVVYFDAKIDEQGRDEPVLAPESQMMMLVFSLADQ